MRTITVKQGIDPRDFSLVAFGGAGPMHAVWLAEELEIREVIIPWSPGTFSAWGMLQTDIRTRRRPDVLPCRSRGRSWRRDRDVPGARGGGDGAARRAGHRAAGDLLRPLGRHALRRPGVHRRRADRRRRRRPRSPRARRSTRPTTPATGMRLRQLRPSSSTCAWPPSGASTRDADRLPATRSRPPTRVPARRDVVFDGQRSRRRVLLRSRLQPGDSFARGRSSWRRRRRRPSYRPAPSRASMISAT